MTPFDVIGINPYLSLNDDKGSGSIGTLCAGPTSADAGDAAARGHRQFYVLDLAPPTVAIGDKACARVDPHTALGIASSPQGDANTRPITRPGGTGCGLKRRTNGTQLVSQVQHGVSFRLR
jgi:hypothetical protein